MTANTEESNEKQKLKATLWNQMKTDSEHEIGTSEHAKSHWSPNQADSSHSQALLSVHVDLPPGHTNGQWLSLCLCLYLCLYLYLNLYLYLSIYISILISIYNYIHVDIYTYICLFTHPNLSVYTLC